MRLAEIAGQPHAVATLRRTLAAGRVPHAYLFEGPRGCGKRTAALGLALALLCPDEPAVGCGRCEICRRASEGRHPDVWILDLADLPDLARERGAESQVGFMRERVFPYALARPHEAKARVLVLKNADEMRPDVSNALLKTLEEPHADVYLVLTTAAPDRLLPTVRSRAQRVRFSALTAPILVGLATARGAEPARAELAAALAWGSASRLLELLEGGDEDAAAWEAVCDLRRAAGRADLTAVLDAAAKLGDKETKAGLPGILSLLAMTYRDALTAAVGAEELVWLRGRLDEIRVLAAVARRGAGGHHVRRALAATIEAGAALTANVNPTLLLERLILDLRSCESRLPGEA
jgi:DNA polymerase-3 subunit delta'